MVAVSWHFYIVCEEDLDKVMTSRFILKQLDYSVSISIREVDSDSALVNYHVL